MKHIGTQTIDTGRLLLRRFCLEDAQAMYRNWASDPEVTRYLTWPTHASPEVSAMVLEGWTAQYEDAAVYQWAIELKELGEPIGSIAVVKHDDQVAMAHVGYALGRRWWNRGIMTEALTAVIAYLFDSVGFKRVEARYDPRNFRSGAVMKKCGMHYEGMLRQADWNNQGICDACYYAILADDRVVEGIEE